MMRARGKTFEQQPNAAIQCKGYAWGRDCIAILGWDEDQKVYTLLYKNPLFPYMKFQADDLLQPCKFDKIDDVSGMYDFDFSQPEHIQLARLHALQGEIPLKEGLLIPGPEAFCIA